MGRSQTPPPAAPSPGLGNLGSRLSSVTGLLPFREGLVQSNSSGTTLTLADAQTETEKQKRPQMAQKNRDRDLRSTGAEQLPQL